MNLRTSLSLFLFALVATAVLHADVTLAPLFTDHAVLQRDQAVPIWGTASPGEAVSVRFGDQSIDTKANAKGQWQVQLDPMSANAEGRRLVVAGLNQLVREDVLVGDVWLAGGQSNMQWPVGRSNDAKAEIAAAQYPNLRHITIERRIAHEPIAEARGEWVVCTPETAAQFTAVGYFFARRLHTELGIPIGVVNSNWGGTPVEAWLSPQAFENFSIQADAVSHQAIAFEGIERRFALYQEQLQAWEREPAADRGDRPRAPAAPAAKNHSLVLYNAMIAPLVPSALRGVIWYQGEANANQPETYRALFGALIEDWRGRFKQPELPFYWAQLTAFGSPHDDNWAFLREAQTQTLALPHTAQAVIIDLGEADDIHPRNKQDVGDRLARLALRRLHGEAIEDSGPLFQAAVVEGASIRVQLASATGLQTTDGAAPRGFEIAGADGVYHPAAAVIEDESVRLTSEAVPAPQTVRYAWRNFLEVNLVNPVGLPTAPFRTDSFAR